MIFITYNDFRIPEDRIRKKFNETKLEELTDSIHKLGLLHVPVFRSDGDGLRLVAGERRVRAMRPLIDMGQRIRVVSDTGHIECPVGTIPAALASDMSTRELREIELEENIIRDDIGWQDRLRALAEIHAMKVEQAKERGEDWSAANTGEMVYTDVTSDHARKRVADELILAKNLDNELIAKAENPAVAMKLLRRQQENTLSATYADFLKATVEADDIIQMNFGDCIEGLMHYNDAPFDVFLMDPPYGIDAQTFRQGDRSPTKSLIKHEYDDSGDEFRRLIGAVIPLITANAAEQSIVYQFCDIRHWTWLVEQYETCGWKVWRWPMIYYKRGKGVAPSPEYGPQRRYEMILYANRGEKRLRAIRSDVLGIKDGEVSESAGPRLHAAGKPLSVIRDLLERTAYSGERICDPFMGSAPVAVICKRMSMYFVGWEKDQDVFNKALIRVQTDGTEEDG